jgi:hypothetical protein
MKYKKPSETNNLNEIDPKYFPKRESSDPNAIITVSEDPGTMNYIINYARNQERIEQEALLEPQRRAEEQKKIQEFQKKQKEESERRAEHNRLLPAVQLSRFMSGALDHKNCGIVRSE